MKIPLSNSMNAQKRKTYIIAGIALIILIIGILSVIFIINSNKNVKDLYFQTEIKNFVNYMNEVKENQTGAIKRNKPFKESPSRTRYEISTKLTETSNSSSKDLEDFFTLPEQAIDIINNTKLVLNSRYDTKKDINMSSLSILLAGQSIVDINTISENNMLGLQVPIIYDKYFIMDKNNVAESLNKFGLNTSIKNILFPYQLQDVVIFSIEDSENLFTDYISFLQENINDDNISMLKNVKFEDLYPPMVSINPEEAKKANKYNVFNIELSEDTFKPMAIKTIDFLFSDRRFVDMTLGNITSILTLLEESGYTKIIPSIESLITHTQDYKDIGFLKTKLTNIINNSSFPNGFNMTLVVDSKGNLFDRKISFSSRTMDEPLRKFNIQIGSSFTKATIEQEPTGNNSDNALIEYEKISKNPQDDVTIHINCVNNLWPDFDLTMDLTKQSNEDNKRKALNTNYVANINLSAQDLGFNNTNIIFDIKREDRYDVQFNMPELNGETSINLNTVTKDEVESLMMDLQFSVAKFLLGNQSILNAFTTE